jgi:hypothetical protein
MHQLIQGINQFVLDFLLAAQKLHFLEQEHIAFGAKLCFEIFNVPVLESIDHLICELLRSQVMDP